MLLAVMHRYLFLSFSLYLIIIFEHVSKHLKETTSQNGFNPWGDENIMGEMGSGNSYPIYGGLVILSIFISIISIPRFRTLQNNENHNENWCA